MMINMSDNFFPHEDGVKHVTYIEKIDLDKEKDRDLEEGNGFRVTSAKGIKKDIKDIDGIFSTRYGRTLKDVDSFADKYKCRCGNLDQKINVGLVCPKCSEKVKFVDDDFSYFGWIVLDERYPIIHANLYMSLSSLIGAKRLENIIEYVEIRDEDGFGLDTEIPDDEPFFGIGLLEFKERFREVVDYYGRKPNKASVKEDILKNEEKVFTCSIPVFTTLMRPYNDEPGALAYEKTNSIYESMSKTAHTINDDSLAMNQVKKTKERLMHDLQVKYNELYDELLNIISGKKGTVRNLFGGRYNFTARNVVVPDPKLRVDQVSLSYTALVELKQQTIINILCKSYNMSHDEAYKTWYRASINIDERVFKILEGIIQNSKEGIPVLINRNQELGYIS